MKSPSLDCILDSRWCLISFFIFHIFKKYLFFDFLFSSQWLNFLVARLPPFPQRVFSYCVLAVQTPILSLVLHKPHLLYHKLILWVPFYPLCCVHLGFIFLFSHATVACLTLFRLETNWTVASSPEYLSKVTHYPFTILMKMSSFIHSILNLKWLNGFLLPFFHF